MGPFLPLLPIMLGRAKNGDLKVTLDIEGKPFTIDSTRAFLKTTNGSEIKTKDSFPEFASVPSTHRQMSLSFGQCPEEGDSFVPPARD
jgi:hypothetical protein